MNTNEQIDRWHQSCMHISAVYEMVDALTISRQLYNYQHAYTMRAGVNILSRMAEQIAEMAFHLSDNIQYEQEIKGEWTG